MTGSARAKSVATLAVCLCLLAACSSSGSKGAAPKGGDNTAVTNGGTPDPNGVLKYGVDLNSAFSDNFDPGKLQNDCANEELSLIYDSVTLAHSNTGMLPGVAQSWTVDNPEQITFHLTPNLEFSDGTPEDAAAVKASLLHTKTSVTRTSLFVIGSIDTPDATTVVLHLTKPQAGDVIWALSYIDGMVYSPAAIAHLDKTPVGGGPFKLKTYETGQLLSLVKNPTSGDASKYKLGGVDFVQVGSGPQAVTALQSGQVDMIDVQPDQLAAVKANPSKFGIVSGPSLDYATIHFRMDQGPFANQKVRQAAEYAVDRKQINQIVFGGQGEIADQSFPKGTAGYDPSLSGKYSYDPAKAKSMLQAANVSMPVKFDLVLIAGIPLFERMAPLIQNEMAAAGFKANLVRVTPTAILQQVYLQKKGDAIVTTDLSNGAALWNNFGGNYTSAGFVAGAMGSKRPEIETLVHTAEKSGEFDAAALQGPMQQASRLVMSEGLEIPLIFQTRMVAFNKARVGGTITAPIGSCRSNLEGVFVKQQ
jgi:peptide/nickel transport system substrate-binding protein